MESSWSNLENLIYRDSPQPSCVQYTTIQEQCHPKFVAECRPLEQTRQMQTKLQNSPSGFTGEGNRLACTRWAWRPWSAWRRGRSRGRWRGRRRPPPPPRPAARPATCSRCRRSSRSRSASPPASRTRKPQKELIVGTRLLERKTVAPRGEKVGLSGNVKIYCMILNSVWMK